LQRHSWCELQRSEIHSVRPPEGNRGELVVDLSRLLTTLIVRELRADI
jgi:hypothetical protein